MWTSIRKERMQMQFEILLVVQLISSVLILILLRKIIQMKQQISSVVKEVEKYIAFITEEAEAETDVKAENDMSNCKEERIYQRKKGNNITRVSKDDAQTQLIQAVLGEYFP